ncbi:hypothetical protein KY290_031148 [Solanum tuberosum]|uniref:Uncharacterized protein n=1 Tax=Solanum tuberosum TaxID=4113 RepID=A0ABQ7U8C3_SOLTU|nr:hypothetical protein KY290_031148 [Solanum tuberosum]
MRFFMFIDTLKLIVEIHSFILSAQNGALRLLWVFKRNRERGKDILRSLPRFSLRFSDSRDPMLISNLNVSLFPSYEPCELTSRQSLGGFYRPERSDEGLTPRPSISLPFKILRIKRKIASPLGRPRVLCKKDQGGSYPKEKTHINGSNRY